MNMSGVYSKNPPGFRYDPPSPAKRFIPDVDGNWPAGVPGTPGATEYIRPQGYWVNDSDWETKFAPNMSNDSILESPTNTDGFIDAQSGTVKTLLPPNSRSFILGPLVDGYNYNHGYDDFTRIGYIQKDTRQFVLLATIQGHWNSTPNDSPYTARVWDGTSSQFTAYNSNFTLAMAQWFKDRITASDFTKNFPYFYSGGVFQGPLSNQPPGSPGGMNGGNAAGTGGGGNEPSDGDGEAAVGSGGTPDIGTETPQGDPEGGNPGDLGLWGLLKKGFGDFMKDGILGTLDKGLDKLGDFLKNDLIDLYDKFSDTALSNDVLEPAFEKFGQFIGSKKGVVAGLVITAANDLRAYIGGKYSEFGDKPAFSTSSNQYSWTANLAMSLAQSIGNGRPVVCDNSCVSSETIAPYISSNDINMMFDGNTDLQVGPSNISSDADSLLNPNKDGDVKKPYMGDGFGGEGGSIMVPFTDGKGNYFIQNVGDKFVRVGGESGEGFDINTQTFTDIPSDGNAIEIVKEVVESGAFANQLANGLNQQGNNYSTQEAQDVTESIVNGATYNNLMTALDNDTVGGAFVKGSSTGFVNGSAAGALLYNQVKVKLGLMEPSELQEKGGYGHVRRETIINVNDLNPEVKNQFYSNYNINVNESVSYESKKRILREITQPLKEIKELPKTQKLEKYRPNFAGKYKPQNTPNVTASKQSDEMVKAKNAAGQTWRTKDRYWGGYESQERMNVVYDNVGHGNQYFDKIVSENLSKKNVKNRQVQEHLNIIAHEKAMRQLDSSFVSPFRSIEEQETYDNKVKDPLFSKVSDRLKKEIDYENKPASKGYPNEEPPEMVNGFHPKYGKRYKYDKLDPHSAEAMPVQGNPEIDANVQKALDKRAKNRKIKNLKVDAPAVENFSWKETLKKKNLEELKKGFKKFKQDLKEGMTTGSIMTLSTPPQGDGTVAIDSVDPLDNTSYAVVTDLFSVGDNLAANTGTTVRSSGSGSGTDGGFNVGGDYLAFQGVGTNDASNTRWAALSPMDSSAVDTITITAIVGNDTNGGEDPDAAGEGLVVMYKKPGMAQARFLNTDPQGVQRGTATSDIIIPLGSSSNSGLNSYSVEVPEYARAKDTQFVLIQPTNSGSEYDHYGITEIKVQRRAPVNVVVPLSDPAAISFINVGTTEGDPKKRKKKVQDQLDASDEYVTSQFGDDFPTGARLTSDDEIEASPIGINQVRDRFSPSKGEDSSEITYVRGASTAQPTPPPSSQTTMQPKTDDGKPIPVKPIGNIAVQGADAANLDAQEPEPEPEVTEPEAIDPDEIKPDPEETKDKTPDEQKQLEIDTKQEVLNSELTKLENELNNITPDREGFLNYLSILAGGVQTVLRLAGAITNLTSMITGKEKPRWFVEKDIAVAKIADSIAIARSQLTGKIIGYDPNTTQINEFIAGITIGSFINAPNNPASIQISDERHEYADENIYVKDGKVYNNRDEKATDLTTVAFRGFTSQGQGYAQMIIPPDGSEPYVHYYDYSYNNLNNPEDIGGELKSMFSTLSDISLYLSSVPAFGGFLGKVTDPQRFMDGLKKTSSMEGWPGGIHGASLTDFKVPLSKLSKEAQEFIASHPLSWTPERVANMSQEEINEQMFTVFKTEADYEDYFEYTQDITRMSTEPVNTVPYAVAMQEYIKLADQYENVQLEKYGEGGWEKFSTGLASENPSEFFASERASREDRDTVLSLQEQIKEKRDSAISDENLMKEIPDPEGERPEFDWDSDPDVVKYDNLTKESFDKYMNYYDNEYDSAWDAYESYAKSNLTLIDGYWRGPESKIARLKELAKDVDVVQKELNRLSAEYDKNNDLSIKANDAYLEKYFKAVKPWDEAEEKRNERRKEIDNQYTEFISELREINKPIWDYNAAQTMRTLRGKDRYGDARWKVGGASWTASAEVAGGSYTSLKFSSIEKIVNEVFSDDKSLIKELRSKLNGTVYRGKNYYFDEYYDAEDEFIDEADALYYPVEHLQKYVDGNYVRESKIKEFRNKFNDTGESWTPEKKGSGRRSDPRSPDSGLGSTGGYVGGDATAAATAASERRRRNKNKNESTLYKKVIGKTLLKT